MRVPILMYHEVAPGPVPEFRKYIVTPAAFAAQTRWLALAGYTPVSLSSLLAHSEGACRLPPKPVVITFDDGFQGCYNYAVPILLDRRFTAVFFIVAGIAGQRSRWTRPIKGVDFPLMDWHAIRSLNEAGFGCGSHTLSHPHLVDLKPQECRRELVDSRQMLEDRLGRDVRHLAYPFGSFDRRVRDMAEDAGYTCAATTEIGFATTSDDPLALPRVPVNGGESMATFVWRLQAALGIRESLEQGARGVLRRCFRHNAAFAK